MNYLDLYKDSQKITYNLLKNSLKTSNISHAYLIESNNNSIEFALAFVKAIMCKNNNTGNCNKCNICNLIDKSEYPDLMIVNPLNLVIKKEQIIELKEKFQTISLYDNSKVYIINGCEYLNEFSSNTLLKFLEEPENNIYAILLTNNLNSVKQTIKSRCQILHLNNNCQSICDTIKLDKLLEFVKIYENKKINTLLFMNQNWYSLYKDKETNIEALDYMIYIYNECINIIVTKNDNSKFIEIINKNNIKNLIRKIEIIKETKRKIMYNCNIKLAIDNMIICMEENDE